MRAYFILRHLPIGEDSQEGIGDVVGECPAIVWEGRGSGGVIAQEVRQQCLCHPTCFLRLIPTRMLQCMRENGNKPGIVHRLPSEVGSVLLAGKEGSLVGPRAGISVRAQRPTSFGPRIELGTSSTMLHTSLSAKKSSPVNCRSFRAPATSKKKGSLRQPAKKR